LRKSKHLIEACKLLIKKKPVVSVYRTQVNLFKGLFEKKNLIYPLVNDNFLTENRQNLPKTFYPNGAIYIFKLKDFIRRKRQIPISGSIPYIMSIKDSLDIDNIFDLKTLKKIERNEKF
jgi:CMP-N,N'-diacetyllegionaminic acid synthase